MAGGELAHLARADDEDPPPGQVAEDLRRQGRRGRGDGGGALADRGLGADALPRVEGLAEEPVEQRADRAALVRSPDLPLDLSLAGNQRVEAGGDAEQVRRGRVLLEPVDVVLELRAR